jgi:hypothetical protein
MGLKLVRQIFLLLFLACMLCACERKRSEEPRTEPQEIAAEEAPVEKAARGSDPLERVTDPGQRLVFILHEAFKRAERNPEHCGAAWEDMEAYLKSRQKDFHDAVVGLIEQSVANPKESQQKMNQLTALTKELFGGQSNPMDAFAKRCPKEKDFLYAWLNQEMTAAVKEWTAARTAKQQGEADRGSYDGRVPPAH